MKIFDLFGRQKINAEVSATTTLPISISDLGSVATVLSGKIDIKNKDDSLLYTLACKNVGGRAVLYLFKGGNIKIKNGVYYLLNDDDGLYYPLGSEKIDGQAVLYLGTGVAL
jgi:hypothetical protein